MEEADTMGSACNQSETPFSIDGSPHDLNTYSGRLRAVAEMVDPRTLLTSNDEVKKSQRMLAEFGSGSCPPGKYSDDELWRAKHIVNAAVNPGTGEIIPRLMRFSAFVPANIPLVYGMLTSTGLGSALFWQWMNQSYNSATNYANRSGADIKTVDIIKSYGIAVGASCSMALFLKRLQTNGPKALKAITSIPFIIPYVATASAGAANVYFTRQPEIATGISIWDENGREAGVSQEAAKHGITQTIISRSLLAPIPVLIIPSLLMSAIPRTLPKRTLLVAELLIITCSLGFALPSTLALFPQKLKLNVNSLEPRFHDLNDEQGNRIQFLYANKGL